MKDLASGGLANAEQMLKELQKLQQQDGAQESKSKEGGAKFNESLNQVQQNNEVQNLNKTQESTAAQTIKSAQSNQINQNLHTHVSAAEGAKKSPESMVNNVVKELMAGQNKMENLMKTAMSGKDLSNQEMIGVQAGVYLFSQQMELASKVVEKATSGVKQMLNTQV